MGTEQNSGPVQPSSGQGVISANESAPQTSTASPKTGEAPTPAAQDLGELEKILSEAETPPASARTQQASGAQSGPASTTPPLTHEEIARVAEEIINKRADGFTRRMFERFEEVDALKNELKAKIAALERQLHSTPQTTGDAELDKLLAESAPQTGQKTPEVLRLEREVAELRALFNDAVTNQQKIFDTMEWSDIERQFPEEAALLSNDVQRILSTDGFQGLPVLGAFLMARGARANSLLNAKAIAEKAVADYKSSLKNKIAALRRGQGQSPGAGGNPPGGPGVPPGKPQSGVQEMKALLAETRAELMGK